MEEILMKKDIFNEETISTSVISAQSKDYITRIWYH